MTNKVGLLIPRSALYPSINFDLVGGLRNGLLQAGIDNIEIKTENIGLGDDEKLIYANCERMLFDGVSIIAGYVNPITAEKLQLLFANAGAIFIALDAGYHFPLVYDTLPNVFTVSLQGALCCRAVVKIAAQEGKKKFAYISSFYEAGYRGAFAFARSLEDEKGAITFNHITPLKRSDFTLEPLAWHLQEPTADGVLACFCGDMLQDFCTEAAKKNMFEAHPVYGSSFMGDEQWLTKSIYPGSDIKVCVPWASKLNNEANHTFINKMTTQKANVFSLLGWEAAHLIAAAIKADNINDAITLLEHYTFEGPRGSMAMDATHHELLSPIYEAAVKKDETTGNCLLQPMGEVSFVAEQRIKVWDDIRVFNGEGTSWFNTYGCIGS